MIVPHRYPGEGLVTEKKIKVGPVCSYSLPVVIKCKDSPIWERNTSNALTCAFRSQRGFFDAKSSFHKTCRMSDMSRLLSKHVSKLKNGVNWEKDAQKSALTPAVVTVLVLVYVVPKMNYVVHRVLTS